jgi:predicted Zn-dependent peptidase
MLRLPQRYIPFLTVFRDMSIKGEPLVAVNILFKDGDIDGQQYWSENLALQMFSREGSRELLTSQWEAALAEIGASVSATGEVNYGSISASIPRPYWDRLWKLLESSFSQPADDSYILDNCIRSLDASFLAEIDDPDSAAPIKAWERLFEGSFYNRARESLNDMRAITPTEIKDAWDNMLVKDRVWIVMVGDVEWKDVQDKVQKTFGDMRLTSSNASNYKYPLRYDRSIASLTNTTRICSVARTVSRQACGA